MPIIRCHDCENTFDQEEAIEKEDSNHCPYCDSELD